MHSSTNSSSPYEITVHELGSNDALHTATGVSNAPFVFNVASPQLWTPETPNLYNITIKLGGDTVQSYTGFRTVSRGVAGGAQRFLLNGEFVFPFGTLDQGMYFNGVVSVLDGRICI